MFNNLYKFIILLILLAFIFSCQKTELLDEIVFDNFIKEHMDFINLIDKYMDKFDNQVFLFGGHIFAQYLLGFGLDESRIDAILDNDLDKQGKRLYGTKLKVRSPKILSNIDNPAVILRTGVYDNEIKNDI